MMQRNPIPFILTAVLLAVISSATAQSGGPYDLVWSKMTDGGVAPSNPSTSGEYALASAVGQGDAGPVTLTGGEYKLSGGFWVVAQTCFCLADMNSDGKRDALDIQLFVICLVDQQGKCSCADVNQTNGPELSDVGAFASDLLTGSSCP